MYPSYNPSQVGRIRSLHAQAYPVGTQRYSAHYIEALGRVDHCDGVISGGAEGDGVLFEGCSVVGAS